MSIPRPLLKDIAESRCLPFVGAGFSLNAVVDNGRTMPLWSDLAKHLAQQTCFEGVIGGPEAASLYERKFGRVHLIEEMRELLLSDQVRPGEAHLTFAKIPFDTVYTTNFDLLLEDALKQVGRPFRSLVGELQLPFHSGAVSANVVKMHGDIRHEEHIVVTREDYDGFSATYPVIATHLSAMLITRTPLFVGYSRTDPDFRQIELVVKERLGRFQRMPFIVQFDPSEQEREQAELEKIHLVAVNTVGAVNRSDALARFFDTLLEELDVYTGAKLRESEPGVFEEIKMSTLRDGVRSLKSNDLLSSTSNLCFVLTPLVQRFNSVYRELIEPAVESVGLTPLRANDIHTSGMIVEQIRSAIQQSRVCIADVSGSNANVLYELGLAQAMGKPTILISRDGEALPFDIQHVRVVMYEDDKPSGARERLSAALNGLLGEGMLDRAGRLIDHGFYREALASLGVAVEHKLVGMVASLDLTTRFRPPSGISRLATLLHERGQITEDQFSRLRSFAKLRNRAVHEAGDLAEHEARLALELVREFLRTVG